jgi:hypothetical protein
MSQCVGINDLLNELISMYLKQRKSAPIEREEEGTVNVNSPQTKTGGCC